MNTPDDRNTEAAPERDDEFEAALRARRRFVPRFDDVDDEAEPSAELDRRVLARARDALRTAPVEDDTRTAARGAPERHYRGPRWAVPLALVATVLLSFTLLLQLDPARNDTVLAPRADAPAASVLAEQDVGGTTMSAPAESAAAAAPAREAIAVDEAPVESRRTRGLEANAPTATRAAPSYAPAPAPAPALAASPPAAPPPSAAALSADETVNAAAPSEIAVYAATRDAAIEAETRERATARREATPLRDALQQASDTHAAKAAANQAAEDPKTWLERIERLRRAGDLDAARQQLAEFRRRHPDIELPPTLRDLR